MKNLLSSSITKSSINYLAVLALMLTFSFAANAQGRGGEKLDPQEMAEKQTTNMVEKLSLDETQTAAITDINLAYATKLEEARESNSGDRDAMKLIQEAINKDKTAEIKQVLTEEQFEAYEKMQAKQGARKGGRGERGSRGGGRRGK